MTSPDTAWRLLMDCLQPLPIERIELGRCAQRYLAQTVVADRDIPAVNRAAMDGYAVRACDAGSLPSTLRVVGEVAAGSPARPSFARGECVRIFTGANVPPDADSVVMVEDSLQPTPETATFILVSGGVSVGKYDLVAGCLRELGATIRYHGVAMKPGKPQLFATIGDNRYVFGLAGNPLAVLVGFHEFALPALRRLAGCPEAASRPLLRLPLQAAMMGAGSRRQYVQGRLAALDSGTAILPVPNSGSPDFVAGCKADGVIIMPDGAVNLDTGAIVDFRPWRRP